MTVHASEPDSQNKFTEQCGYCRLDCSWNYLCKFKRKSEPVNTNVNDGENYSSQLRKMQKDWFGQTLRPNPSWVFIYNVTSTIVSAFKLVDLCQEVLNCIFCNLIYSQNSYFFLATMFVW